MKNYETSIYKQNKTQEKRKKVLAQLRRCQFLHRHYPPKPEQQMALVAITARPGGGVSRPATPPPTALRNSPPTLRGRSDSRHPRNSKTAPAQPTGAVVLRAGATAAFSTT